MLTGGVIMRTTRSIFAALFAVALALPFAACETEEAEFQETPAAEEETEVYEEEPLQEEPLQEEPLQEDGAIQ